ncbi:MAG: hypothetical protein H8E25_05275 [Planctomycetes bacterium]|nr:hypothetical protein [Planctomycetota bacterium]
MPIRNILLGLFLALPLSACGYQILRGDLASGIRFAVPSATDSSEFAGLDAELTQAVRKQLFSMIGAKVGDVSSDYRLELVISKAQRSARAWSRNGGVNMGMVVIAVKYKLIEINSKQSVLESNISRNQEFLFSTGENTTHAFSEAIADITQQIVLEIAEHLSEIN